MKCAASPGGTIRYCIAAQTPVNTVKQGSAALSSVARKAQTLRNVWMHESPEV